MADAPAADFDWLALTKPAPPEPRPDVLLRPRLFDTLHQALASCPLTLVSAPAGSGKTTLLADWLSQLKIENGELKKGLSPQTSQFSILNSQFKVAWLSLDRMTTTRRASSPASAPRCALRSSNLPPPEGGAPEQLRLWLTRLINALIAAGGPPCVLILDDLHWISDPAIFALLDQLVERIPRSCG